MLLNIELSWVGSMFSLIEYVFFEINVDLRLLTGQRKVSKLSEVVKV